MISSSLIDIFKFVIDSFNQQLFFLIADGLQSLFELFSLLFKAF